MKDANSINIDKDQIESQIQNANYGLMLFLKIIGFLIGVGFLLFILKFIQKFISSTTPSLNVQLPIETLSQP
jgi:ABC-type antimicrobial peptide transport system permease subunit